MLRQITFIGLVLLSFACKKKDKKTCPNKNQECDNSLFTLQNNTNDTIFYGIGTNAWEDTLLPGQQRSLNYGKVKVVYNENCEKEQVSWSTHQLNSNVGSWAFNIDHCDKRSAFKYDGGSNNTIKLYDTSEY